MIAGIGTDLVHIPRMQQLLIKFGDKAARKLLCDSEFSEFQQSSRPAAFLAKRFAAKEATAKAFGCGFRDGLSLQHIAVVSDKLGKPQLQFSGTAESLLRQQQLEQAHLSLSDDGDYATAFVILTGKIDA